MHSSPHHSEHHSDHHSDHSGRASSRNGRGGRHRARRGAVRAAVLTLLAERPMHGYELITELETRSEGRWRPSPGAIYPALEKLEDAGAIESADVDGKRQYTLTAYGREMADAAEQSRGPDEPAPWDQSSNGRSETRKQMSELVFQVRQISRFGTDEQRAAAAEVLDDTKRKLYAILADS